MHHYLGNIAKLSAASLVVLSQAIGPPVLAQGVRVHKARTVLDDELEEEEEDDDLLPSKSRSEPRPPGSVRIVVEPFGASVAPLLSYGLGASWNWTNRFSLGASYARAGGETYGRDIRTELASIVASAVVYGPLYIRLGLAFRNVRGRVAEYVTYSESDTPALTESSSTVLGVDGAFGVAGQLGDFTFGIDLAGIIAPVRQLSRRGARDAGEGSVKTQDDRDFEKISTGVSYQFARVYFGPTF